MCTSAKPSVKHWSRCASLSAQHLKCKASSSSSEQPMVHQHNAACEAKTGTDPWAMSWRHFDFALHLEMYSTPPELAHTRGSCPAGDAAPAQGDDGPWNLAEPKEPRLSGGQKKEGKKATDHRETLRAADVTAGQLPTGTLTSLMTRGSFRNDARQQYMLWSLLPPLDCFLCAARASSNNNVAATWVLGSRDARPILAVEPPLNRQIRHPVFRGRGEGKIKLVYVLLSMYSLYEDKGVESSCVIESQGYAPSGSGRSMPSDCPSCHEPTSM